MNVIYEFRKILVLIISLALVSCGNKKLEFNGDESLSLSGSVVEFFSASLQKSSSCTGENVYLYAIDDFGNKSDLIASTPLKADGSYLFTGLNAYGLNQNSFKKVNYLVYLNCSTDYYERFVTGESEQKLSKGNSILSYLRNSESSENLRSKDASSLAEIYDAIEDTDSLTAAFSTFTSSSSLRSRFRDMFGIEPSRLMNSAPQIRKIILPNSFGEEQSHSLSVLTSHWSLSYNIAISWRLNGNEISNSPSFTFTPNANAQGPYTLQVFVGNDDGEGKIDTSKPYAQRSFNINVYDLVPANAPSLQLLSDTYTNDTDISLQIVTGALLDARPLNCRSFEKMAIVESDAAGADLPPLLDSAYTIDCTNANNQAHSFTLSGAEGDRRISLWVKDSAGNISSISSNVTVRLDTTAPIINSVAFQQTSPVGTAFVNLLSNVADNFDTNLEIQATDGLTTPNPANWIPFQSNLPFTMGITQGTHTIYFYARDDAGNLASTNLSIQLDSGTPPQVAFLGPSAGSAITDPFTLSIHVHDNESAMPSNSVQLEYSIDNKQTWNLLSSSLTPHTNSSNMTTETLSYNWSSVPGSVSGKGVIFKITARDAAGNSVQKTSSIYNLSNLRVLAGGVSDANGISARFTMLNTKQIFQGSLANLVRNPQTNRIFLGDFNQGLRTIDGATGVIELAPLAGGNPVRTVDRDNFGVVYGCNQNGIFTWNENTEVWDLFLSNPCRTIQAWRNQPGRLYFENSNNLYYYDGSTVTHVAFNGSPASGTTDDCYSFHPNDAKSSCSGSRWQRFAVHQNGDVYFGDNCPKNGNVSGCNIRYIIYRRATGTLEFQDFPDQKQVFGITYYRYFNNSVSTVAVGIYDEDPLTGDLYYYSNGQIKQLIANPTFFTGAHNWGMPQDDSSTVAIIAGVLADSGDTGPAAEAHLNDPGHVLVGHANAPDADNLYVPKGVSCCWSWSGEMRVIDSVTEIIDSLTSFGVMYSRNPTSSLLFPSTAGGFISTFSRHHHFHDGGSQQIIGNDSICNISPTDGVAANLANWPRELNWYANYQRGLHHTDGYIYLSGYANTVFDPDGCSGTADIFIKRFSYNPATGAVGNVEHVAGVSGAPAGSPILATGQSSQSFHFAAITGQMKENLSATASGEIFVHADERIRIIKRVNPSDPSTWTIHDVTDTISGLRSFALTTNINSNATSGYIYYVTGDSNIYRYHLGSGVVGDLSDDTVDSLDLGGIDNLSITDIGIRSDGKLVFTDRKANGTIYEITP